jgi:ribosomal protein S18 acetylase RimI-like enzyme
MVAAAARGRGIATQMCRHSQEVARELGFKAMQFNLVVATNEGAIRLWQKLGFTIIGRLPRAFHHARLGYVDALIMYKWLRA